MRNQVCLWKREVEANASVLLSGAHFTSSHRPGEQLTSSQSVERCWSGGVFRRSTMRVGTSMMTRSIMVTSLSPASGYFHACSSGCPSLVLTRYMSPVLRWSCWKVAILRESGDHATMALSVCCQPALSVA